MSTRYTLLLSLLIIGFCVVLSIFSAQFGQQPAWVSALPPLIAIGMALVSRHVLLSLSLGVLAGVFLAQFSLDTTVSFQAKITPIALASTVYSTTFNAWNLQIMAFLVAILAAITVMIVSGGLKGVIRLLAPYARSGRSAQLVTFVMGLLVFIDDYANTVLVGSSMRPITDTYKVSREKLAFIIDSTSAPVAGIAFISTWIGYEVGQIGSVAKSLGLAQDGYAIFFDMVFFRFYCLFMLIFVFVNILSRCEFGPMAAAQERARLEGSRSSSTEEDNEFDEVVTLATLTARISAWSAVLPMLALFAYFLAGLWVDGGGIPLLQQKSYHALLSFADWRYVVTHSENNMGLLMEAGLLCFVTASVMAVLWAKVRLRAYFQAVRQGVKTALTPITILVLAWSLKTVCDMLHTDTFLVSVIGPSIPAILFPVVVFALSAVTAISTGTSWGTMAILIPMVMPIALALDGGQYDLYTMLSIAAVLDGAIFGDHCSPISDTTIMSSSSTGCELMQHVVTQFPYSLFVAILAVVAGYLPVSLGWPVWLSFLCAATAIIGVFTTLALRKHARA